MKAAPHLRRAAALGLLALAAFPNEAGAQLRARPRLSLAVGTAAPLGPEGFQDFWGPHLALAGGLHFRATARAGVGVEVGYYRFGFDGEKFEEQLQATFPEVHVGGNDLVVVPVTAQVEVALRSRGSTRPFASLGGGYYRIRSTDAAPSGPGADLVDIPGFEDDAFGLRLGLGVRTALVPGSVLFLDAVWHVAWTDPDPLHFVPVRVGVRF